MKQTLRSSLRAARAARSDEQRVAASTAITRHGLTAWSNLRCVAAYYSFGFEPPTHELVDALRRAGVSVLLPVVEGDELDWAEYDGDLAPGRFGISQPAGPRLGVTAVAAADVVVVPALAVDRQGTRLGQGQGYYDRALRHARSLIVAVVYDEELLDHVPHEEHDVSVNAVLTPSGLRPLPHPPPPR